ncbi:MAG: hypothetical protein JXA09_01610 [Anaerolineae bacterium]|nr:hypothetical protein [Anaerolineae bacterium]
MSLLWHSLRVNVCLHLLRPVGYAALGLLVLWALAVPSIGVSRAEFAARTSELGYPPLSDAQLSGLGAAQVASGFMTLIGIWLLIDAFERERALDLDELIASMPVAGWRFAALQYLGNVASLLLCTVVAYGVALLAFVLRFEAPFSAVGFFWPSVLFPLGSAFLIGALPLLFDVLRLHHIARGMAYVVVLLVFNLGPFALASMTYLDHPRHPQFLVWLTTQLALDTIGVWYLQGLLDLVLQVADTFGTTQIPARLFWVTVVRPRVVSVCLGLVLAAIAAWRFDRFEVAPDR